MKSLAESIKESLNEAKITRTERVMIDELSNADWKKFAKLVVKQLNDEFDLDQVLAAMKALAGQGHELCPGDFYATEQESDEFVSGRGYFIAAMFEDDISLMYDPWQNEWVEGQRK